VNYRSETMLQWCREHDRCELRCSPYCFAYDDAMRGERYTIDPCHPNWEDFGKGKSIKAHDWGSVPGCRPCHDWLDFGGSPKEVKMLAFMRALGRWFAILFSDGRLAPAKDNEEAEQRKERARHRHSKRKQHGARTPGCDAAGIPKIVPHPHKL